MYTLEAKLGDRVQSWHSEEGQLLLFLVLVGVKNIVIGMNNPGPKKVSICSLSFFPIFVCLLLFLVLMGLKIIDHKEEVDNNKACQGTSDYLLVKGDLNDDRKKKKKKSTDDYPYQDWEEFLGLVFPAGGENQWGNLQAAILTSYNMMMMMMMMMNPVFVVMDKNNP